MNIRHCKRPREGDFSERWERGRNSRRFELRVASVEGAVGGAESRIAEATKEISERCDGGLVRLREQAEKVECMEHDGLCRLSFSNIENLNKYI